MLKYGVEQKTYKIGKYEIGGDPRKAPTALIGSIFYLREKEIFKDETKGIINKNVAEDLINKQEEIADKTGLIPLLDVVLSYPESIEPILDFVCSITDSPIIADSPTLDIKLDAIKMMGERGLQSRIIYNSITPETKEEEYALLSENKLENFLLLIMETKMWTTQARMEVFDALIKKAESAKFSKNNFLIDCCVIDYTSLGLAMNAMEKIKDKHGYPVGSGAHNAVDTWRNLKAKFGKIKKYSAVVASTITLAAGADFILYGPIEHANIMFPNVAFVKAAQSQLLFDEGKMAPPNHPIFKIG
ncbi:MAG: tetrahydromethanopterin S-methyltransferase subunit H [Candidatus Lokiarchaeota archaeon]|nr:tetrahydromethanopterin S-methyltransferase subunit H [Candidatus Lokiarchaeota archaeon]